MSQMVVNLAFKADTSAALKNLDILKNSLNEITSIPFTMRGNMNHDIQSAVESAKSLRMHLSSAMDVKTGNLNLNKLNTSLKQSGQSLSSLTTNLLKAGTAGEQAFLSTYSAIARANMQLTKSNGLVSQFMLTLKNTAKWQLSSSLLHGVISGLNSAITYAKDLNTSLNNIQIVTNQGAQEMAIFAQQANKAAKALRTSTVAYSDAALIYYQQGLNKDEVLERANATVKLANITGESASEVSNWMTSVWNNFDNGSKSLEYYADVMTALGAATASSSEEIATGLEKFAAVADTVGLSYENAAAALATITAETRQSADVVGTALKTLFARIQDLDLGKTLDDGTTLGQYSQALASVGINIKDNAGNLKDMDRILDEMGEKWKSLNKDQQVALAQSVAGVRQYTQLIALMDNYDSYKSNVSIAQGSEGTLTEQQEIFEQSWEGASKKVKASMEDLYNSLIPTDFIIDITNGLGDVVEGFTDILDAAGGLKTIMLLLANTVFTKFQAQIASAMDTGILKAGELLSTVKGFFSGGDLFGKITKKISSSFVKAAQAEPVQRTADMNAAPNKASAERMEGLESALNAKTEDGKPIALSEGFKAQVQNLQTIEQYNTKILNLKNKMTESEFQQLQLHQQELKALGEEKGQLQDKLSDLQLELELLQEQQAVRFNTNNYTKSGAESYYVEGTEHLASAEETSGFKSAINMAATMTGDAPDMIMDSSLQMMEFNNVESLRSAYVEILEIISKQKTFQLEINDLLNTEKLYGQEYYDILLKEISAAEKSGKISSDQAKALGDKVKAAKQSAEKEKDAAKQDGIRTKLAKDLKKHINDYSSGAQKAAKALKIGDKEIESSVRHGTDLYLTQKKNAQTSKQINEHLNNMDKMLEKIISKGASFGSIFVKALQGTSQMSMGISMITGAFNSMSQAIDEGKVSVSTFLGVITSLGMGLPMVVSGFQSLMTMTASLTAVQQIGINKSKAKITALTAEAGAEKLAAAAKAANIPVQTLSNVLSDLSAGMSLKEALAKNGVTAATWAQVAANIGLQASAWPILLITLAIIAAVALLAIGVMGIIKLFKMWQASTPEGKLKALEEAAKKSKEAMNEASEAVKNLKSTLDNLKDSYKNIENLEKGTLDWLSAVMEVNSQVSELIEKYPELANYIDWSNGYAKITDEGMQKAQELAQANLVAKTNRYNEDQIKVNEQKLSMLNDKYKYSKGLQDGKKAAEYVQFYGIDVKDLSNEEDLKKLYEEKGKLIGDEKEALEEFLEDYQESLMLQKQINSLENQQLLLHGQRLGSSRNIEELKDVMNISSYNDIQDAQRNNVEKKFGDWHDHINYSKDDTEWDMIQDFMDGLEGTNKRYVAQRKGKMVIEIDGEEVEFSKEEVYKDLTELYSGEEFENRLRLGLQKSLGSALGDEHLLDGVTDLETLNSLDEVKRGLDSIFQEAGIEADKTNEKFQELMSTYVEIKDNNGTEEAFLDFEKFAEDTKFINKASEEFKDLTQAFSDGTIQANEYASALRELNAIGEIDSMTVDFTKAAEQLGLSDKDAEDMQNYAKHLLEVSKEANNLSDSLAENAESAADLSIEIYRMNKGIDDLSEGFSNWSSIIKKSNKSSAEYAKAMSSMKTSLANILDVEEDLISSDFVTAHMDKIEKAAEGDADAIDELRASMDEEIIQKVILTKPEELQQEILAFDNKLKEELERINEKIPDIQIGAVLQDEEFLKAANNLVVQSGMTADEANAYFAGIGYEQVYNVEEVDSSIQAPNSKTLTEVTDIGWSDANVDLGLLGNHTIKLPNVTTKTTSIPEDPIAAEGAMNLVSFSGDGKPPEIKGMRKKATGSMNNYSSSNSGGGSPKGGEGSSKKTSDARGKKTDIVERYKEINDKIDDISKESKKASKFMDRLWGPARIKQMEKVNELLEDEIGLLKDKQTEAQGYLSQDKNTLNTAAGSLGLNFEYDDNGNISNYEEQMTKVYNAREAMLNSFGTDISKTEQERLDAFDKKVKTLQDAMSQYEKTKDLNEELETQLQDKIYELQDKNYAIFEAKIDLRIDLNKRDLKKIDHQIKMLGDDPLKMAEVMALTSQKADLYDSKNAEALEKDLENLQIMYENGEISQSQFIEGMKRLEDEASASKEALFDYNQEMQAYYEQALQRGSEMFKDYMSDFDSLISTLEHYKNVMSLIGREQDYEAMNEILQGQIDVLNDKVTATEAMIAAYQKEADDINVTLNRGDLTEEERKNWEKRLRTVNQLMAEEQGNLQSYLEKIGAAANEILSNSIEQAFKEAEKAMTGGMSFDSVLKDMERMDKIQEEYLTTTNKMYETNKLLTQAQQKIDKTSNLQAKEKFKQYQDYIEQLQISGNLSKQELKIAEAKYKVLEAEMALEEAKDAKSTVRLTRDSEGNFGYVYTADQENVDTAMQSYLDAQNELYNIGLEGSNEYREKVIQTQQETLEELKQLEIDYRVNHLISEEEYNQQRAHILETSNELLTTYQEAYQASQFVMANSSYANLMKQDSTFYNGQESKNKTHYSNMEDDDTKYYGGIKLKSAQTQKDLNKALGLFGVDVNKTLNDNYTKWGETDEGYYKGLMGVFGKIPDGIDGWLNKKGPEGQESAKDKLDTFYGHLNTAWTNCKTATETWKTNMQLVIKSVGLSFDNPTDKSGLTQKINNVKESSDDLKEELVGEDGQGGLVKDLSTLFTKVGEQTSQWELHWKELSTVNTQYQGIIDKINTLNGLEVKNLNPTDPDPGPDPDPDPGPGPGPGPGPDPDPSSGPYKSSYKIDFITVDSQGYLKVVVNGKLYNNAVVNGGTGKAGDIATFMSKSAYDGGTTIPKGTAWKVDGVKKSSTEYFSKLDGDKWATRGNYNYFQDDDGYWYRDEDKGTTYGRKISQGQQAYKLFNTGGYTGEWGPDGKLAVLHQKELVLNADDTENILNTVSFVRDLISSIDSSATMSSLRDLFAYTATNNFGSNIEQDIKIYAEFPSATNHSEIEEAFNNLLNTASQYANRKN